MKTIESKVLTVEEKKLNKEFRKEADFYRDCEDEIDKLSTRQGETLINIRDLQLWKVLYKSFEEACQKEFGISRVEAHRKIEDVTIINGLKTLPLGNVLLKELDVKQAHIRVLATTADDDESRYKVLEHIKDNGIELTAKTIKEVSDEILPPKTVSDEERSEKKRLELAERKRLAEEKRAAVAEEKRLAAEKKAADKLAAKQAKEAEKAAKRDKRTEFKPETFSEREPGEDDGPPPEIARLRSILSEKVAKSLSLASSFVESLGPLVRALDDVNGGEKLPNFKALMGHYDRAFNDGTTAKDAIGKLSTLWGNGK